MANTLIEITALLVVSGSASAQTTFQKKWELFARSNGQVFYAGDLDGNGSGEVIATTNLCCSLDSTLFYDARSHAVKWIITSASVGGSLDPESYVFAPGRLPALRSPMIDYDGDGTADIFYSRFSPGPYTLALINPRTGATIFEQPLVGSDGHPVVLGLSDADGDGILDLVLGMDNNSWVGIYGIPQLATSSQGIGNGSMPGGSLPPASSAAPNPASGDTSIKYSLENPTTVKVQVYDQSGRMLRESSQPSQSAGRHSFTWDGKDSRGHLVAPGKYYLRVDTGVQSQTRSVVILR